MITTNVSLGERTYPIHIGAGLMVKPELYAPHIREREVFVVTNETVGPLYLDRLKQALQGYQVDTFMLPEGEQYKNLDELAKIFDALLAHRYARDATLVALGGGVVGDITGFAAACYQRGIDFLQVPTTLLAQVDSSVGGKTAVNHPLGKNMIGAFHQPTCVIADTDTLATLPPRELRAGMAEVIKYGLIRDREFFEWLEVHLDDCLALDPQSIAYVVQRSCEHKAQIVAADEKERGQRALLNLGHTFGHAIEAGLGYGQWLHGEAVAAGMCMAADLSMRLGWISGQDVERISRLLTRADLPCQSPEGLDSNRMRELMSLDKKVAKGCIRFVLLKDIGAGSLRDDYEETALQQTLESCRASKSNG